jgi:hypothetical protein
VGRFSVFYFFLLYLDGNFDDCLDTADYAREGRRFRGGVEFVGAGGG